MAKYIFKLFLSLYIYMNTHTHIYIYRYIYSVRVGFLQTEQPGRFQKVFNSKSKDQQKIGNNKPKQQPTGLENKRPVIEGKLDNKTKT